eukprot:23840-Chlamydomonas_euryale.AAC.3
MKILLVGGKLPTPSYSPPAYGNAWQPRPQAGVTALVEKRRVTQASDTAVSCPWLSETLGVCARQETPCCPRSRAIWSGCLSSKGVVTMPKAKGYLVRCLCWKGIVMMPDAKGYLVMS